MRKLAAIIVVISGMYSSVSFADVLAKKDTERQFYEPQILSRLPLDPNDFQSLDTKKQDDLLAARASLLDFYANTEKLGEDVSDFLGDALSKKFKNRTELYAAAFWLGTTPYVISVKTFRLLDQNLVELSYYVVVMLEGAMVLREDRARLRKIGTSWKIVRIAGIE